MSSTCFLCGHDVATEKRTPELTVSRCPGCGHHTADHKGVSPSTDYHSQYDQGGYLANLEITRRRQARRISDLLSDLKISPEKLLDFGAGRGWFLKELKHRGVSMLAGADTSEMSIKTLNSAGIETAGIHIYKDGLSAETEGLSFKPAAVSLLDVIEHFPPADGIERFLRELLKSLPDARTIIIKVPISDGILFRVAALLSFFGWHGPYHQLFQVGTFPPHFHYFSKKSLALFLKKLGLRELRGIDDSEVDDILGRVNANGVKIAWLSNALTALVVLAGKITSGDARIVAAEITRPGLAAGSSARA